MIQNILGTAIKISVKQQIIGILILDRTTFQQHFLAKTELKQTLNKPSGLRFRIFKKGSLIKLMNIGWR